jgi:DNA helicase-2/ATP-dependent DNA helicase PcrA
MQIYNGLNPQQREAVEHTEGPLLILAGAGSGKTKVITHRISYLIEKNLASTENIIALTFTNKAADEMKNRVMSLLKGSNPPTHSLDGRPAHFIKGGNMGGLWVSTFHSACLRILRRNIDRLGYKRDFIVYDANDSLSLIKECMKEMNISDERYSPKSIAGGISSLKSELMEKIQNPENNMQEAVNNIYAIYQKRLKENNALDFDDLLMKTILLFENEPLILDNYRNRFKYVMVDEYQDTNHSQYKLVRLLSSGHRNICVVGDDDQCIYQWRGATIRNIMEFEKDYPDAKVIKLEENYRSTQTILDAAWAVVSKNMYRKDKRLWTRKNIGERIFYYRASDEHDESRFITSKSRELHQKESVPYKDIAVFYRTNAQSRVLEDALRRGGIPYRIYGGLKFFDRKEIKDILAYLKIAINPNDSVSFKRIINVPARGIGSATVEKIEQYAKSRTTGGISLVEAVEVGSRESGAPIQWMGRRSHGLKEFYNIFKKIEAIITSNTASAVIKEALDITGYLEMLKKEGTDEAEDRMENLKELITAAEEYEERTNPPSPPFDKGGDGGITGFLDQSALVSDADAISDTSGAVSLMTLHISKGLEFPSVFITGLEGRIFPHISSLDDPAEMEEERRLCYVGITRAKERLFLVNAEKRRIYGQEMYNPPSEFIKDIPRELLSQESGVESRESKDRNERFQTHDSRLTTHDLCFSVGSKVAHPQFGSGVILQREGSGDNTKLTVFFRNEGKKKLALKHTSLKKIL